VTTGARDRLAAHARGQGFALLDRSHGHIGDVTGDKLIYDAPTARGGSGGPILNLRGEVVGINSAYIDGFSGGTLGITASELRPLMETAKKVPASQLSVLSQNQSAVH